MKKIVLIFLLTSPAFISKAQLAVKFYNYRPTGEFGFVMKPTFSAEVAYMRSFEDDKPFRSAISISYLSMKTRMDTFPTTGWISDGTTGIVLPGYQVFQKYDIIQFYAGMDWGFIRKDPYFVYIGLDFTGGFTSIAYTSFTEQISNEGYTGGGMLAGYRARIGAEYDVNDMIGIFAHVERTGWVNSEPASRNSANMYGIGVKLNFE